MGELSFSYEKSFARTPPFCRAHCRERLRLAWQFPTLQLDARSRSPPAQRVEANTRIKLSRLSSSLEAPRNLPTPRNTKGEPLRSVDRLSCTRANRNCRQQLTESVICAVCLHVQTTLAVNSLSPIAGVGSGGLGPVFRTVCTTLPASLAQWQT